MGRNSHSDDKLVRRQTYQAESWRIAKADTAAHFSLLVFICSRFPLPFPLLCCSVLNFMFVDLLSQLVIYFASDDTNVGFRPASVALAVDRQQNGMI